MENTQVAFEHNGTSDIPIESGAVSHSIGHRLKTEYQKHKS